MADYSSNSNKSKEARQNQQSEKHEVKAVASGQMKKRSGIRKFFGDFVSDDARDIKDYVIGDILLPAAKDTLFDMITNSVGMALGFGSSNRRPSNRGGSRLDRGTTSQYGNVVVTDYSGYSNNRAPRRAQPGRYRYNFEDIEFRDKRECDDVLFELDGIMGQYNFVSVADFYRASGIDENDIKYTDSDYGWYNLGGSEAYYSRGMWHIRMPQVEQR